jgi:hypothetical protein
LEQVGHKTLFLHQTQHQVLRVQIQFFQQLHQQVEVEEHLVEINQLQMGEQEDLEVVVPEVIL